MPKSNFCRLIAAVAVSFALIGCSSGKESEPAKGNVKTTTEQATEAVGEYGKRPIDKARAAQQIGEERTGAIDQAVQSKP